MDSILTLAGQNLLTPMILCFALGGLAALARSDLSVPEAAAKTMALRCPAGVGVTMMTSLTPATFAGMAFIKTDEGYEALPPGTYKPTRSSGVIC